MFDFFVSRVSCSQAKVVEEIGFGELMKVKPFEILRDIVSWVLNHFDASTMCIETHEKMVRLT